MKTDLKGTALPALSAAVFLAGCAAWVFPRVATATAGDWFLPALSLIGLVLATAMASAWPWLRALLLVLSVMLVVSWNRASITSTSHFAGASLGCLLMVAIPRAATTTRLLRYALLIFLGGAFFMVAVGLAGASLRPGSLLDTAGSGQLPSIRLGLEGLGPDGVVNSNALAAAVLLAIPIGASVLLIGTRDKDIGWRLTGAAAAVVALGVVALVLSHSRTAAIAVWLIAVGTLVRGMRPWVPRLIAGIVIVAPMLLVVGRMPFLTHEIALRDANNAWVSARSRVELIDQALDRLRESPWVGVGLNEFRHLYTPRPGDVPQAREIAHVHNIVLQTALDIGIVGSAAYWSLLAFLWVRAHQAASGTSNVARVAAVGGALSLVAATLFGLTDAVPLGSKVGTLQWAAGGLILAAWQLRFDSASTSGPS